MSKTEIIAEPGTAQIIITREFDAPPDLVFRAHTEPELLVQWLGPRDLTLTIDRYDVRDGGRWRYVHTDADGQCLRLPQRLPRRPVATDHRADI